MRNSNNQSMIDYIFKSLASTFIKFNKISALKAPIIARKCAFLHLLALLLPITFVS